MILLCKIRANPGKIYKQFFYKDKILIEDLKIRYYNNHVRKNIDK